MNCPDREHLLNEHLDGTLDPAARAEMEGHLEACGDCRRALDGLRGVKERAAALPRAEEPPRDLWPAIRGQLAGGAIPFRRSRPAWWARAWMAAAAVLVLGVAAILLLRSGGETAPPSEISPAALRVAEQEYLQATDELLGALDVRREDLSPQTLAVVDENLRIIDEAIGRVRTAIESDPGRTGNGQRMIALYGRKVDLLRQVVHLPAEG